jgi:hypothetical protein
LPPGDTQIHNSERLCGVLPSLGRPSETGAAPARLVTRVALEEAHERQMLRAAGPVYQFRHAWLEERLARGFEDEEDAGSRVTHA